MSKVIQPTGATPAADAPVAERPKTDYVALARKVASTEAFWIGVAFFAALVMAFWPLVSKLVGLWFAPETYYNHGPLVPLMAAYLVVDRWPHIKDRPVRPFYPAIVPIGLLLYANFVAARAPRDLLLSVVLVLTILLGILFVAGWRWMTALAVPTLFLLVGLPIWEQVIDVYTQPLQNISSDLSYGMLKGLGFEVLRDKVNPNTLYMDHFQMFVGVPCSGLRTILAMIALVAFAVTIGKMKWWANALLISLALPLSVFVNGFRIALIGVVGESFGDEAGHQFHDYSGHISLVLLVVLFWKLSQKLGMK